MDKTFWLRMLQPDIMVFLVPIVIVSVVVISKTCVKITKMLIAHNERIALIQHGIHPDYPPDNKDEV
ncbi:MAG: hypothetical protein ABSA77_05140 [Thermoguttaceae bacterium]|jgi:hypothetical protein